MQPYLSSLFGNASSVHWYGQQAKQGLERARAAIARTLGAESGELVFTSGGTEADNLAIRGVFYASRKHGKTHLITTAAEHHAVLDSCEALREEGAEVTILPVDRNGRVNPDAVGEAITDHTCLVSVMHANNEVGTISPLSAIAEQVHARGVLLHADAVQTLGKVPVNVQELHVDLLSVSAHKIYGPKGVGALYVKRGTELENLFWGGGQERGRRPGTENVAFAVGFAKAAETTIGDMAVESPRLRHLCERLARNLQDAFPEVILNGHAEERLPHILNISFDDLKMPLEGETLVLNMDLEGIAVSSGSACTSGSVQPSHVLLAMGRSPATAKATLRFSFGRSNTEEDVDAAIEVLTKVISRMRRRVTS
jgi:cysteine desulfurase